MATTCDASGVLDASVVYDDDVSVRDAVAVFDAVVEVVLNNCQCKVTRT